MKLKHSILIACLSAAPLCAQQVGSKTEDSPAPKAESSSGADSDSSGKVKNESRSPDSRSKPRHGPPNAPGQPPRGPEQKPVAYIGVLTREVTPELRTQFSLPEGFGLMVEEVMPDSPAESAGLKVHDILLKFEDQRLVSMEQLMLLVRAKNKGDSVSLTLISGGREMQVPVTLGEHLMPAMSQHQPRGGWPHNGMSFFNGDNLRGGDFRGFQNQSREFNEQMERFQKEMREYQERIQDWARQGSNGIMPQPPMFNMPGQGNPPPRGGHTSGVQMQQPPPLNPNGGNVQQFNFSEAHAATNITRRDDSGEYTIRREDGKATFVARPKDGKEQSWPINTDDERKAVPQEFRDKLRLMDGASSGIHIEVNPGPGSGTPAPGATSQPAPGPKSRSTSA